MSVAVIGCGYWGKNLIRNFSEIGELSAVCDEDEVIAKKFSKQYEVPALTFDEVLKSSIKAVAIAAPAQFHAELSIRAFEANKNVYVEKPLAMNINEANAMIQKSRETGAGDFSVWPETHEWTVFL